ncbi:hypothetical protein QYM36_017848 [Artemia franciscana]|uniref:Uncharacterized protein n=1 Tax=Artemia franciscana TaxID=6661 RepID=A0AA88H5N9_ARTSF|nr:hypothetical protein QYM36_017848 [Artemia franciscana]
MLKFHGLNESESGEETKDEEAVLTIEAKEDNAICLHNEALSLVTSGEKRRALFKFNEVLDSPFVKEVCQSTSKDPSHTLAEQLQYSCYKNIATLLEEEEKFSDALDCYIYAVEIDKTDASTWYKLGKLALKLRDFQLARKAFEEGFTATPSFWPCLDQLITLLFAIFDYVSCLYYIKAAFKMDPTFLKGHAIRDAIVKDQPTIKEDLPSMSGLWDTYPCDEGLVHSFMEEALSLRKLRFQVPPMEPAKQATLIVDQPTFLALCHSLIEYYDSLTSNPDGRISDGQDLQCGTWFL